MFSYIIKYLASENPQTQTLDQVDPDANDPMIISEFAKLLKSDSKAITQKFQMHLLSHYPIYYEYNIYNSRVHRFNFPRPILANSKINSNDIIWFKQDNVWVNP